MTKRGRPPHPDVLTPREWEVLSLVRDGLTNEQIAERIGVTIHAARYHVSQILSKLGVATREEAAAWQPGDVRERRWERALGVAMGLAALIVVCSLGVLAWGVLRGSDNDAQADAIPSGTITPSATPIQSVTPTPSPDANGPVLEEPNVRDMQLITETFGWMLTDQALFQVFLESEECARTHSCEIIIAGPRNITPPGITPDDIRGVHFLDDEHGWLVAKRPTGPATQLVVFRTANGGVDWEMSRLGIAQDVYGNTTSRPAHFDFIDENRGWLVIDTQQTMNTPSGELWRTRDGGETWEELTIPAGRPINFINENDGWLVGGVVNERLYATHDGGATWEDASDIMPLAQWAGPPAFGLPTRLEDDSLVLPVTLAMESGNSLFILFRSTDGGSVWPEEWLAEVSTAFGMGIRLPSFVFSDGDAIAFNFDGTGVIYTSGSFQAVGPSIFAQDVQFFDKNRGWALVGICSGQPCPEPNQVMQTDDGGLTWAPVDTPENRLS